MTLSFSYIAPLTNFKVSYKNAYKKRAPLWSGEAPKLSICFYTTALLCHLVNAAMFSYHLVNFKKLTANIHDRPIGKVKDGRDFIIQAPKGGGSHHPT